MLVIVILSRGMILRAFDGSLLHQGRISCTGDFAPPEPEFRAEFWEANLDSRIWDPNS